MTIVNRRVFYGKPGLAGPLVEHIREFGKLSAQHGMSLKERLLTDYASGRTDRVVSEWEVADMAEFAKLESSMASNEAFVAGMTVWERKMNEMIDYAEVENWTVQ